MKTWIINLPLDLRDFFVFNGEVRHYLAVNKLTGLISPGDVAILWGGRHAQSPGILGYGMILTGPMKPTDIPTGHRNLYDPSSLQIGVIPIRLSYEAAIIPEKHAYQLPSLNETKQAIRVTKKSVYPGGRLFKELRFILEDYPYLFRGVVQNKDSYFKLAIHLLREKYFSSVGIKKFKTRLMQTPLICAYCDTDFERKLGRKVALSILELHEITDLTGDEYIKIDPENFEVVCPTCHKMEHDMIRN